jgi:calcium/calmodulin-dependent protein kinase I
MGGGASTGKGKSKNVNAFQVKYHEGEELGTGAFSVVKRCTRFHDNWTGAVKVIRKEDIPTPEEELSLKTEISILGSLDHEHIIKLEDSFDEKDSLYIVTELVEGGELFDRIVRKSFYSEKDARDLIRVFLTTIAHVHSKGIVHRDLKPENLLLVKEDDDSDIKIADFGLAKRIEDLDSNEQACGTPAYVAPEILRRQPYKTEVDIWSIGVICYVLLAGYPPFYDEDMKRLFRKIKDARYSFHPEHWDDKSDDAKDIITKMLCVDVKKRWTAEQLLEHPWIKTDDSVLADKNITGTLITMRKFNARRRFRAAATAIILTNRMKNMIKNLTELKKEEEEMAADGEGKDDESYMQPPEYLSEKVDSTPSTNSN